jgi:hypothetical protein
MMFYATQIKSKAGLPSTSPMTFRSRSPLLLGHCSHQLYRSCSGVDMVYSQAEGVLILKHYFTSESSDAVHKVFNKCPDKEVLTPHKCCSWHIMYIVAALMWSDGTVLPWVIFSLMWAEDTVTIWAILALMLSQVNVAQHCVPTMTSVFTVPE